MIYVLNLENFEVEIYLTNIHFGYLLSLLSWRVGKWDMSYGNYLYYSAVVVMGVFCADCVQKSFPDRKAEVKMSRCV